MARDVFFVHADEKTMMEFYQHLGILLPRKPFLDQLLTEYRHRRERHEGRGLAPCEYAVVTSLVNERLKTQMRGHNVTYYKWLECSISQSICQLKVVLSCDDLHSIIDVFHRSRRLFLVLNIPNAVLTLCCIKASGVYTQCRRKVLLCFLDCPNSFLFDSDSERHDIDLRYETSEDVLVTPMLALSRDTNHALVQLSSSQYFQIVSEWDVDDFFRLYTVMAKF